MSRASQVEDILQALAGATVDTIRRAINGFDAKDSVAAVAAMAADGNGGSQTLCYEFTVDDTTFPSGNEVVGTGINLEVGDRIIDAGVSIPGALTNGGDFFLGMGDLSGVNKVTGNYLDGNTPNDGGPYSGDRGAAVLLDWQGANFLDGQGRLPCTVLTAHELMVTCPDAFEEGDEATISVYVIPAASVTTLPTPVAPGP